WRIRTTFSQRMGSGKQVQAEPHGDRSTHLNAGEVTQHADCVTSPELYLRCLDPHRARFEINRRKGATVFQYRLEFQYLRLEQIPREARYGEADKQTEYQAK